MKKLLLIGIFAAGAWQAWQHFGLSNDVVPLHDGPYVAVYGRNSCGYTKRMLEDLKEAGIDYHYYIVDEEPVSDSLHQRMEAAGISTRRYNLPVVDVSGHIKVRPQHSDVISEFRSAN